MAKPRKKWEPELRFGGNPAYASMPRPLGTDTRAGLIKVHKPKKRK